MNNEDVAGIFEKLNIDPNSISPDMINGFLNMMGNSKSDADESPIHDEDTHNNTGNNASSNIDMDMLFKMKSMIDGMNVKDDPRSNLLYSLKPYLKESRKDKLDQYVQLMNMSKMIDFLPFMGGGKKQSE